MTRTGRGLECDGCGRAMAIHEATRLGSRLLCPVCALALDSSSPTGPAGPATGNARPSATCRWCKGEVKVGAKFCPHCGQVLRGARTLTVVLLILLVIAVVVALGVLRSVGLF